MYISSELTNYEAVITNNSFIGRGVVSFHKNEAVIHSLANPTVGTLTDLLAGRPGLGSRQNKGFSLFAIASRSSLEPTQPPIQWVPEIFSPGVNRSGYEADSPPSSAEDDNTWSYTSTPACIFMALYLLERRTTSFFLSLSTCCSEFVESSFILRRFFNCEVYIGL